jgi:hypothetical protein
LLIVDRFGSCEPLGKEHTRTDGGGAGLFIVYGPVADVVHGVAVVDGVEDLAHDARRVLLRVVPLRRLGLGDDAVEHLGGWEDMWSVLASPVRAFLFDGVRLGLAHLPARAELRDEVQELVVLVHVHQLCAVVVWKG